MNLDDLQDASLDDPRFDAPQGTPAPAPSGVMAVPDGAPPPQPAACVADGTFHPLDDGYVPAARIGGWIATANVMVVIPVGIAVLFFVKDLGSAAALGMGVAGALVIGASIFGAHFWPKFELRYTRWRIDADGLEIRRGVVWRHTISVPRERIQHTDVAQGPIQRRFGLATLSVHTAGTHHSQIELSGISYETAQAVRNYLLEEALESAESAPESDATPEVSALPPMTHASVESATDSPFEPSGTREPFLGGEPVAEEPGTDAWGEPEDDHERA